MNISKLSTAGKRIQSIDLLRAMTMFFMIFVNDLWTLTGVPEWLEHTAAEYDGMGFSDIIFPLFLFIVGLSIPLAIKVRIRKNQSYPFIIKHILTRTFALLIMGIYMVNYGAINQDSMNLNKNIWQILMAGAIFLIWMDYKRIPKLQKKGVQLLKVIGIGILIYLAIVYRDGTEANFLWMKTRWWGILGLIGWAYLLISIIYLLLRKKLINLIIAFIVLLFMNIQENAFFEFLPTIKIVISASNYTLVMAGALCTAYYLKLRKESGGIKKLLTHIFLFGAVMIAFGFIIRPSFPISKILATPSWTSICIGIGLISYVAFYIVIDKLGFVKWGAPFKPAGTSTLTCYLIPYFVYPIIAMVGFQWPEYISNGATGIIKSLLFSLIIILFVGLMEKRKVVLKI
jgi:predicted acyltransferase